MFSEATGEFSKRYHPSLIDQKKIVRERFTSLFNLIFDKKCHSILDIGCGTGFYFKILKNYVQKIFATEISELYLKKAVELVQEEKLENVYFNLSLSGQIPFKESSFDSVLVFAVFHHIDDIEGSIDEIYRVLKPGGRCIVIEPNILNPAMFLFLSWKKHERGILKLTRKMLQSKLKRKFKIINYYPTTFQVTFTDYFSNFIINILDIFPESIMNYLSIHYVLIAHKEE